LLLGQNKHKTNQPTKTGKSQLCCDSGAPYLEFLENQAGAWDDTFETCLMVRVKHALSVPAQQNGFTSFLSWPNESQNSSL